MTGDSAPLPPRRRWRPSEIPLLAGAAAAGLALRALFILRFSALTPDGRLYLRIADAWSRFGVFGLANGSVVSPTDLRLPGYPAFLAAFQLLFGTVRLRQVFFVQAAVDMATCAVVGLLASKLFGARTGRIAFVLAALCPFTANYTALVLTETLSTFTTALALLFAFSAAADLDRRFPLGKLLGCGAAVGAGILLRPDNGILLPVVVIAVGIGARHAGARRAAGAMILAGVVSLAPLVPWTARNWVRLHEFQPLTPRVIVGKGEFAPDGFDRWIRTWILDYVSDQDVWWKFYTHESIDPATLPRRAFGMPGDPQRTVDLIAEFNQDAGMVDRALDGKFAALARERIRAHPLRYFVLLPAGRMLDIWFRPRTEMLPVQSRWWEFKSPKDSAISIGLALLNAAYVGLALCGAWIARGRWETWVVAGFVLLRTSYFSTYVSPEDRYTLECFPVVFVLAAVGVRHLLSRRIPVVGDLAGGTP